MGMIYDEFAMKPIGGTYVRRRPAAGEARREAQQVFIERSASC
jgi:hypothetical protein